MIGAVSSVHFAAIATVGLMLLGATLGALWRLGSIVKGWRDETARAVGEVAGLVGDWCDEVDDHLGDQDDALRQYGYRLQTIEQRQGINAGQLFLPKRPRRRPRRMQVAEAGLHAPERHLAGHEAIERERQGERRGYPPV